jgi:hypothetical protein
MLVGLIVSIPVSVAVEPTTATSTILFSTVYRLQLLVLPKFDRFGLYTCDTSLSVPTRTGFYTSKLFLRCSHTPGESDITLGSDRMSACGAILCDGGFEFVDPLNPVVTSPELS